MAAPVVLYILAGIFGMVLFVAIFGGCAAMFDPPPDPDPYPKKKD